jgi:hypothetical protein
MPEHIKRVSRALGYTLFLSEEKNWHGFSTVLRARLTERERAALSYASLNSMDYENAYMTAEAVLGSGASYPMAPLFNPMDQATFWANLAAPDELDAYAGACVNRMPPRRLNYFIAFLQQRAAA